MVQMCISVYLISLMAALVSILVFFSIFVHFTLLLWDENDFSHLLNDTDASVSILSCKPLVGHGFSAEMLWFCPQSHFQLSGNETQRQTEFLGVLAASQVEVSTLGDPQRALCRDRSVHWTRRADGESNLERNTLTWTRNAQHVGWTTEFTLVDCRGMQIVLQ